MTDVPSEYVTKAELQQLVNSINNKFSIVDKLADNTSYRFETLLKLLCQNSSVSFSSYVKGLRQFATFADKVKVIQNIPKISDRIKAVLDYNETIAGSDELSILADDVNILKDVVNAEAISAENLELCNKLESTDLFKEILLKYAPKAEGKPELVQSN